MEFSTYLAAIIYAHFECDISCHLAMSTLADVQTDEPDFRKN